MTSMITAFTTIFLPIFLGMISRTGNFISAGNRPILQQFAVRIAFPALIFSSLINLDSKTASQFLPLSLGLFLFMGLSWLMSIVIINLLRKKISWVERYKSELVLFSFTGNIGYICLKLQEIFIGIEGLQRGIFYTSFYWPFMFIFSFLTVLVFGLSKTKELNKKEFAFNIIPILTFLFSGLIVGMTGITLPTWMIDFFSSFSSMAMPLILFCMGLSISLRKSLNTYRPLYPFLILRFGLWALATFILIQLPWFDENSKRVLLINALAPLGVSPIVVSDMFGLDTEFIANSTIISTVLFLFVIPIMFLI